MGARRMAAGALVALAAAGGSTAALAAAGSGAEGQAAPAKKAHASRLVHVGIDVVRFQARGRHLIAHGVVRGKVADVNGHTRTVRRRVAFAAQTGDYCRVLYLRLDQLDLKLLGLDAHLGKVRLVITGKRSAGVLGKLFCKLAHAVPQLPVTNAQAARTLNRRLRHHPMHVVRFRARIRPRAAAAQAGTCSVLDLVLGPLHLDLLGLIVDLNQVHLTITAVPGGGTLGDLFCQVAGGPATNTTTTGTTTTGTTTTSTGTTTTTTTKTG